MQFRRLVRVALEEEACVVAEAEMLTQGLRYAGTGQPDLLMLDLRLPDGTGVELIRELRAPGSRLAAAAQPQRARTTSACGRPFDT